MFHRVRVFLLPPLLTLCIVVLGVYGILGSAAPRAHAAGQAQPFTQQKANFLRSILDSGDGTLSEADFKNPPSPICTAPTSSAANVNTDCEGTAPHNETTIAVNPTNSLNRIGSVNDYQLFLSSGGRINETIYSRAHVTFDGGKTWTCDARLRLFAGCQRRQHPGHPGGALHRWGQDLVDSSTGGSRHRHLHQPRHLQR